MRKLSDILRIEGKEMLRVWGGILLGALVVGLILVPGVWIYEHAADCQAMLRACLWPAVALACVGIVVAFPRQCWAFTCVILWLCLWITIIGCACNGIFWPLLVWIAYKSIGWIQAGLRWHAELVASAIVRKQTVDKQSCVD